MGIVYITNEPYERNDAGGMRSKFNLTPAAEFGTLEVLVPAGTSLISSVPTIRLLRDRLKNFSDADYLLPVGDPSVMMAAGAIAAEYNRGKIKVLRWDRQHQRYIVVQLDTFGKSI